MSVTGSLSSSSAERPQDSRSAALSARELVLLRRAAEDAIHAGNPRFAPFVEAVANPLKILALVDMAQRSLVR